MRLTPYVLAATALFCIALLVRAEERKEPDDLASRLGAALSPTINYDESKVPDYALPELLRMADGSLVATRAQWEKRRAEILNLYRENVYGRAPGRPQQLRFDVVEDDRHALDGAATLRRVAIVSGQDGRRHRFTLTLFLPNAAHAPVPVFLLLNHRSAGVADPSRKRKTGYWPVEEAIARGVGIAVIQSAELAPDNPDHYREGVIRLFEGTTADARAPDAWGAIGAWAWGAQRAMDYLVTDRRVDAHRVAVLGHSRSGKTALWAAAQDERFALAISNDSGEIGAALARRRFGETVAAITAKFPYWFAPALARFANREDALPVDQHMLLSLIAPRALYVASAEDDLWSDPRGEFLALAATSPVYALWGEPPIRPDDMPAVGQPLVVGRRGYHIRSGGHDLTLVDWEHYFDFAERLWSATGTGTGTGVGAAAPR